MPGIKPIYYKLQVRSDFVFASELKAICQYPGFDGTIDRDALALYMRHNYVPAPHCIYQGLHKLPPGSVFTLDSPGGPADMRQFWSATNVAREGLQSRISANDHEATEQLARWPGCRCA